MLGIDWCLLLCRTFACKLVTNDALTYCSLDIARSLINICLYLLFYKVGSSIWFCPQILYCSMLYHNLKKWNIYVHKIYIFCFYIWLICPKMLSCATIATFIIATKGSRRPWNFWRDFWAKKRGAVLSRIMVMLVRQIQGVLA